MGKVIQMIKVADDNSLFICGFDKETNILSFRTSYEPNFLQEEEVLITDGKVMTGLYFFDVNYLQRYLKGNK